MQLWIVLLGVATGMRTMTGITVLCWFAWLRWFPLENTWASWVGSILSVIVFTLFALGEYYGDTLPQTPSRKALGPATARIAFGALVGAVTSAGIQEPVVGGMIFGVVGALLGTYGGYALRMRAAKWFKRDLPAAIAESVLALALAVWGGYGMYLTAAYITKIEGPKAVF